MARNLTSRTHTYTHTQIQSSGYKRLRFLRKEAQVGEKMYFELLQLHPIQVNLSFFGTGAILDRASTGIISIRVSSRYYY